VARHPRRRGGLPATTARREPGGWSLTGRKIFSAGAAGLRWMAVWARTDEPVPRAGSFLVRSDAPGITIEPRRGRGRPVGARRSRAGRANVYLTNRFYLN
jgi:alkylation response protein AidB-like acyl-CoA dehydrogenase